MNGKTTVLYNGACPVCRREIEHYRGLDRSSSDALEFADISGPHPVLREVTLSEDAAKRRLHVIDGDGQLLSGIPAFAAIWTHLPRYRWLSVLSGWPVFRSLLPWIYEPIAYGLYRWDKHRKVQRSGAAGS